MKHFSFAALAGAALLCAATTSCGDGAGNSAASGESIQQQLDKALASSKTFADSLTVVDGTFIGGFFNSQMSSPALPKPINKKEFIRGLRDALRCDTADMSYAYGFNSGTTALNTYVEMDRSEGINREAFINAIIAALKLDSVSQEDLAPVRMEFENYNRMVSERAEQRAREEAKASEAGQANIKAAEEYLAQLSANGFTEATPGIYEHVITPGTGETLTAQERVNVTYSVTHLDGTEVKTSDTPRPMYVSSPSYPILRALLPLMKMDETAEFFVPYEQAFGEVGNPASGVGPCEALMVKVTISPMAQK